MYFNPFGVQWRTHAMPSMALLVSTEATAPGSSALSASTTHPEFAHVHSMCAEDMVSLTILPTETNLTVD